MTENTPKKKKSTSEKGHAKFLESLDRLIAVDATLDPAKLDAPADLTSAALVAMRVTAGDLLDGIGAATANWRTAALERQTDADELDSMAAQAVALLEARRERGNRRRRAFHCSQTTRRPQIRARAGQSADARRGRIRR